MKLYRIAYHTHGKDEGVQLAFVRAYCASEALMIFLAKTDQVEFDCDELSCHKIEHELYAEAAERTLTEFPPSKVVQ